MAFIPKLPTWHNDVDFYRLDGGWGFLDTITGQVYTPLRNQDDESGGLLYFEFPKEIGDILRDSLDGAADVAEVTFPGGGWTRAYRLREVKPRWLGFPNQHFLAELSRLGPAEWNLDTHSAPLPLPPEPPPLEVPPNTLPTIMDLTIDGFENADCDDCESLNNTYEMTWGGLNTWVSEVFSWECSASGLAQWFLSDYGNYVSATLNDPATPLSPVYYYLIADISGWDKTSPLTMTFSNPGGTLCDSSASTGEITVPTPLLPPPGAGPDKWELHLVGNANGSCSDCATLDGDFTSSVHYGTTYSVWDFAYFAWACVPSGTGAWQVVYDPATGVIKLYLYDGIGGVPDTWTGTLAGWDEVADIVLALDLPSSGLCTWPSVSMSPTA